MTNTLDLDAVLAEARANLPMERILAQSGHGPTKANETSNSFACPFCKKPQRAGIFLAKDGKTMLFKCHGEDCASEKACDEIGLVM